MRRRRLTVMTVQRREGIFERHQRIVALPRTPALSNCFQILIQRPPRLLAFPCQEVRAYSCPR